MRLMPRSLKAALLAGAFTATLGTAALSTAALAADTLKIGMPAKMFLNLVEFVAQDKGFYEKNGLSVELVHIADSSIPVRSLIAGELDLSQTGMSETLAAIDKGADLKTIGGVHTGLHYAFYVNAGSGIKDVTDLPGKKVGISSPGSLPHVVITALMRQAGMTEEQIKSVQWVSLKGSSARINGVLSGTVDATVSNFDPKAAHDKNAKVLFVVSKKLPTYVMTPWDVRSETIATKRDVLKRFVKAELEATRWIFDNEKGALDVAKKHFDYNDEQLAEFYEFYRVGGIWNPNGTVTADQAKYMQDLNVQGSLQKAVHPADKVLDTTVVQDVLTEIGTYKP
ncbi:ABC transporter substrate-binding protein [Azospirillum rugosum]|uniref:NitT/TauT family transport system substrate-binding protein n=1 Tax=Azospirillum rugosum TaxID=416170 RepID=A0ABS4SMS0_9PROT|nr:ABC transporter substrate-binding protein [Azospirillum rugosum]MBP2293378.1 NitT/TauT family transport system substrate-binding protein [Azospirillum rugosum]